MSTRSKLLVTAELLLRTKGYAAFSYADLAHEVGVKKASIHHHFPTKEGLSVALVESYLFRFDKSLAQINEDHADVTARLKAFSAFFAESAKTGMLPLCGALAAELAVLPDRLKALTKTFFEIHLAWLEDNLSTGQRVNTVKAEINPKEIARAILSVLEGSCYIAWALKETVVDQSGFELILKSSTVSYAGID
ncbi:TetR/AcrR family transcriptional regulator [Pseudomonas sp. FP597]|uniref:TetR/AcrR family transcriptional regulator n=1 Tax=Pseudomonas lactucae TaxID=2813360 RepID=A0A9X0YAD2_9PSED|nr:MULTISPECIES: TetR/AcrR family transcriptional regulator [Pseudomonas]MBN2975931.1 TetR/AcrR family transcriptional regulator [Pseudomonas lactucae]MBN2985655.1 TetR/AcrR family transcriptional regulator [Pseudomonas lactucae]WLI08967.1 TetR/AcrR family transcriptional regulator [Pseudomonas sp. FP597]